MVGFTQKLIAFCWIDLTLYIEEKKKEEEEEGFPNPCRIRDFVI